MIWPLLKGLGLTLKAFFSKPVTIQYPEEKSPPSPRWRGTHYFEVLPDGDTKCVACGLCVTVCPPKAIRLVAVERDDGRRYPEVYELDAIRCIYCGLCEEACPVNAIKLSTITNLVGYRREELKWDKGRLIERRKEKEEMG